MTSPYDAARYEVDERPVAGTIRLGYSFGPSENHEGHTYVAVGRPWTDWRMARARRRWQRYCDRANRRMLAARDYAEESAPS